MHAWCGGGNTCETKERPIEKSITRQMIEYNRDEKVIIVRVTDYHAGKTINQALMALINVFFLLT